VTRRFWRVLDRLGHAIPVLRFGRVRYAVCLRMLEHEYPDLKFR
jgi:hypothetical protein